LFELLPDPRHPRRVRHALPVILALGLAAVLTGARSFAAIGERGGDQSEPALARLGVGTGPPSTESTIRRAFARLDVDLLDRVLCCSLDEGGARLCPSGLVTGTPQTIPGTSHDSISTPPGKFSPRMSTARRAAPEPDPPDWSRCQGCRT